MGTISTAQVAPSVAPEEKEEAHRRGPESYDENQSPESVVSGPGGEGEADGEEETIETKPGLPFSKARCIALVVTVTGASLLNVCSPATFEISS